MSAYVYVVTAPDLSYSKVGYAKNLWSRLSGLASSSSAPFKWVPWRAFSVDNEQDARKLEGATANDPVLRPSKVWGKSEFFKCGPSDVVQAIERQAKSLNLDLVRNVPTNEAGLRELADNFSSFPKVVLDTMPAIAQQSYWIGVSHAIRTLAYMEHLQLGKVDLWQIHHLLKVNATYNEPELWSTILGHLRNNGSPPMRHIAENALSTARNDHNDSWSDWQSLD